MSEARSRTGMLDRLGRIVVKIGTTSIMKDECTVNTDLMDKLAAQVSQLLESGKQVILVSSGAIGLGVNAIGASPKPKEIPIRQAAASVGQSILMNHWKESFDKVNRRVAQILLTYSFYSDRVTYLNLRNNISTLLEHEIVPIINENDAVCTNEIEAVFGDNDTLSAMVASKMEADLLLILSDVDGLYDRNPRLNKQASLIPLVEEITPQMEALGGDPTSARGVGGMRTKIQAAKICAMAGCHTIITNHNTGQVITRAVRGEEIGTLFLGKEAVKKNRTRWIILSNPSGRIRIDGGAHQAIRSVNGLLPSGVMGVEGDFDRGDIVELECDGEVVAKGISDYQADELRKIMGRHTSEIENILGYKDYINVIKRENIGFLD
jgi:glutamate 5-kinase